MCVFVCVCVCMCADPKCPSLANTVTTGRAPAAVGPSERAGLRHAHDGRSLLFDFFEDDLESSEDDLNITFNT